MKRLRKSLLSFTFVFSPFLLSAAGAPASLVTNSTQTFVAGAVNGVPIVLSTVEKLIHEPPLFSKEHLHLYLSQAYRFQTYLFDLDLAIVLAQHRLITIFMKLFFSSKKNLIFQVVFLGLAKLTVCHIGDFDPF